MPWDDTTPAAAPSLAADAWQLAFGDLPVEDGLRLREVAQPRHFPASDPRRYDRLLSVAGLDAFLATDAARLPRVSMADAGQNGSAGVASSRFADDEERVDPTRLHACFDAGCTLVVSQFHELHPPLARFCRGLEKVFLHPMQVNVYLTPPGAQGFHAHYDTHDVLILQVSGTKHWRVWPEQPIQHTTRRVPWSRQLGTPAQEPWRVTMQPGDALYIPRGAMHDASTQAADGEPSLHLTVGFLDPCWGDALRSALDIMEPLETALREAFPTWRMGEPGAIEALSTEAATKLSVLLNPAVMERLTVTLLDRLAKDQMTHTARRFARWTPGPEDRLQFPDMMHYHMVANPDGGAVLRWAGDPVAVPAEQIPWLEQLGDGASAAELGGEEALEFCRKLYALGLLERAGAPSLRSL